MLPKRAGAGKMLPKKAGRCKMLPKRAGTCKMLPKRAEADKLPAPALLGKFETSVFQISVFGDFFGTWGYINATNMFHTCPANI